MHRKFLLETVDWMQPFFEEDVTEEDVRAEKGVYRSRISTDHDGLTISTSLSSDVLPFSLRLSRLFGL